MPKQTAREYWRERLVDRIDARIREIEERNQELFDRVRREAHEKTLESLGLATVLQEHQAIQSRISELVDKRREIEKRVRRQLKSDCNIHLGGWSFEDNVEEAVDAEQAQWFKKLLETHEIGKDIARLERARDSITDKLWLANGPNQIKAVCAEVDELLGTEE